MTYHSLPRPRVQHLLDAARHTRILVLGDVMLDRFIWGHVSRISPEAPVPVVDFERESYMPGGAANVAHNLATLQVPTELFGILGADEPGQRLKTILTQCGVACHGLLAHPHRPTTVKTRIVAHQQQVVRLDCEVRTPLDPVSTQRLLRALQRRLPTAHAVIIGDYGKGVVTQHLLDRLQPLCRARAIWLSLDPKPVHPLNLAGLSLLTPNRKEAFDLAQITDSSRAPDPLQDTALLAAADQLLTQLRPAVLLITLGDQGMLLCQRHQPPFHIPTVAQEVYDVSGAGDTVIAFLTVAIAAGASPLEAAILSNHAAGVVVGKVGTATVTPDELLRSF